MLNKKNNVLEVIRIVSNVCFTALMFEVMGECNLPQGVTEARLKK